MKIFLKYFVIWLLSTLVLAPLTSIAHDAQSDQDLPIVLAQAEVPQKSPEISEESSWISNGKDLGPWWNQNPKKYEPIPRPLLCHVEASYTYSEKTGNTEQTGNKGNFALILRKGILTSDTNYTISKADTTMSLNGVSTSLNDQFLREIMTLALTERLSLGVGAAWERNASQYIENRVSYFGGLMGVVVDSPNLNVWMSASYGFSDMEYMNENIQKGKYADFPSVEDYDYNTLYFLQKLHWDITETISFSENANYVFDLDNSDYYNWKLGLSLNFKLTKAISFLTSYTIRYENNAFNNAVQDYLDEKRQTERGIGDMEKKDTSLSFGIKVSF
ncbi:DUF481 domain-containing protein [Desulfonema magnum]|uniref:DUF481 n=1 Tax=Desulfonema magnum TaxID=45655 RepID=A0A975BLR3_9BACT|nr:DUF481 domain-containing protein [Desulfonema magnum]QTA87811.1 DUF481 [Desulfonema magnum]